MSDTVLCPKCQSEFTYEQDDMMVCSHCFHEWKPGETADEDRILDANGNELKDGDTVVVVKDLPVKGAPKPVKAGTKVKIVGEIDTHRYKATDIEVVKLEILP